VRDRLVAARRMDCNDVGRMGETALVGGGRKMDRVATGTLIACIRTAARRRKVLIAVGVLGIVLGGLACLPLTAGMVVLNRPHAADVIVVALAPGRYHTDLYYYRAVQMLSRSYGDHLLFPADATGDPGHTEADEARRFIQTTGGQLVSKISVCPEGPDEFQSLDRCLTRLNAHTVLMIAPASESRCSLMLYKDRLPNYSWSVAAVTDPAIFGSRWWSNRRWAKTYVEGLQRLIYTSLRH
ncbi:MAG: hypothetical protein ACRD3Q_07825, partial [Terriglobales bacterium]